MVIQYPHIGKVYKPAVGVWSKGELTPGSATIDFETICRIEPVQRSGDQYITGPDGKKISFFGIVYMPLPPGGSSSFNPSVITGTYAGETIIYVVPVDIAPGITSVDIPVLSGKKFNIEMNGHPLLPPEQSGSEFTRKDTGGFDLVGVGTLQPLQRFKIEVYYEVNNSGPGGFVNSGGGYIVQAGLFFEVWDGTRLITKQDVKQFSKGQLNMRVWL